MQVELNLIKFQSKEETGQVEGFGGKVSIFLGSLCPCLSCKDTSNSASVLLEYFYMDLKL